MEDGEVRGEDPETFSRAERIALAIASSWTRLITSLSEELELLETAEQSDRQPRNRPRDLQGMGREIGRDKRHRAERAADEVAVLAEEDLKAIFSPVGDEEASDNSLGDKKHYPPSPEQLFVFAMIGIGPTRLREVVDRFVSACDSDLPTMRYALRYLQWKRRDPLTTVLGRTLLTDVVAAFEEFLAALLRLWGTLYPEALSVGQGQVAIDEVAAYASTDDIIRRAIDQKVDDLMDSGIHKWAKTLSQKLQIHLDQLSVDWPAVLEAFARRHTVVHAGGRADEGYLKSLPDGVIKPGLGSPLVCDKNYISRLLHVVEQLATALSVAWMAHFLSGEQVVSEFASEPVLRALEQERWNDALTLADLALRDYDPDHPQHELRVNRWMALRELGEDWEKLQAEIKAWEPPRGETRYQVAKAALLRDEAGFLDALSTYEESGHSVQEIATWPLVVNMKGRSTQIRARVDQASARGRSAGAGRPRPPKRRRRH